MSYEGQNMIRVREKGGKCEKVDKRGNIQGKGLAVNCGSNE
jgi:hypothetical protein